MKCHFAYSVPFVGTTLSSKIERKARRLLQTCGVGVPIVTNRQPGLQELGRWPMQSPFENTRNLYVALAQRCPTRLYHLTERVRCGFSTDDIFLGHPYFPHRQGAKGVTELAMSESIRPKKLALITPLHCDVDIRTTHINRDFLCDVDRLLPAADVLFGIMGQYWWDRWDKSPFHHWKSKMVRLDMAVDCKRYPRVKRRFSPPGRRGFFYVGYNDWRKGSDFLSQLMGKIANCPRGWIGHGPPISNVDRISESRALDPVFMEDVARTYDFFISPSRADPNPTTILESMAWGFPVVCTPQSGYYETAYRHHIFLDDLERSVGVLQKLQHASEDELVAMSDAARTTVESEYTWDRFTGTVLEHLGL